MSEPHDENAEFCMCDFCILSRWSATRESDEDDDWWERFAFADMIDLMREDLK